MGAGETTKVEAESWQIAAEAEENRICFGEMGKRTGLRDFSRLVSPSKDSRGQR